VRRPELILSNFRRRLDRERNISGVCSICGDILLEQLDDEAKPDAELLRAKLNRVFEQHVAERHSEEAA
jgi:hypothetical protein